MSKWFFINFIFLIIVLWKVIGHNAFPFVQVHIWLGVMGALFILYNWTRNAVFETIRNVSSRKTKIRLARFSKKVVTIHRWTGNIAFIVILIHALIIIYHYGFSFQNKKMVVGLIALFTLAIQVFTGWLRLFKPTVRLRFIHLYIGMTLFLFVILHILL
ncbi:hypothetical protein [Ornithinibacillus sp. 179-J 7C1 HS]|uniref:hypothetical protein n=1 Tax=Ornithinibacillus sp. 179-J 7C1 HS TaxID=3142384 RepID=UPI00399EF064